MGFQDRPLQQMAQTYVTDDRPRGKLTAVVTPLLNQVEPSNSDRVDQPNTLSGGLWEEPFVTGTGGGYVSFLDIWQNV